MADRNSEANSGTVAILLCTMNGERYLAQQLQSIAAQTYSNWRLWISDDGSSDRTVEIAETYRREWGEARIAIRSGPKRGFVENFLSLTREAGNDADYFAYADQDDVWEPDKLARAVSWLRQQSLDVAVLYTARTRLVDEAGRNIGMSSLMDKPPSFANALVQNICGGNTSVFNQAARKLLCAGRRNVVAHDWWLYQVVTGCGGQVFYDPVPNVRYRQHGGNLVGSEGNWLDKLKRVHHMLQGRYRHWNDMNIGALEEMLPNLTPENRLVLKRFSEARRRWLIPRLFGIWASGVHKQTLPGNLGMAMAAMLNKI